MKIFDGQIFASAMTSNATPLGVWSSEPDVGRQDIYIYKLILTNYFIIVY